MKSADLEKLANLIASKLVAELRKNERHLTPREYARKARIAESKVYDAIKTGKLIALPSNPGSALKRWKIPQWSIEKFEAEQYQEALDSINQPKRGSRRAVDAHVPNLYG